MFAAWKRFRRERQQAAAFKALPAAERELVFYSEGPADRPHFERILRHLQDDHHQPVAYLTSRENDPILSAPPAGVRAFCIGEGTVRTMTFATLEAKVVVMTMPDLQAFHIKRSALVRHYAYVHHSIVSCHMVYQPAAFDHFDSIFCVGPHHVREVRAREQQAGLPAKHLFEHGYGRLDTLLEEVASSPNAPRKTGEPARILIAPSWGPVALLERHGDGCVAPLLAAGYRVTLRPHPQTRRFRGAVLDEIAAQFRDHPRFVLEENIASKRSLLEADLMISDWSGAALEFAFSRLKPVLFVDVPRKINNPQYEALGLEPLEVSVRQEIGVVVPEGELARLGEHAADVLSRVGVAEIAAVRQRCIYNPGHSGAAAANEVMRLLRVCG